MRTKTLAVRIAAGLALLTAACGGGDGNASSDTDSTRRVDVAMVDSTTSRDPRGRQERRITYRFEEAGTFVIGCHEPGHYAGGMKITVNVT